MYNLFFFFNDTATTEIYTLSLHDALPAASAVPMRAGRLKLTSRPPPAAAPALRKVRRDRVCTAVEINSPNGFPQQDHTRYGGVGPTLHPTGEKGDQFGACTRGPP